MKRVFLGRIWHWLLVLIVIGLGWLAGRARLHVTDFNLFLVLLIVGAVVALLFVLVTSRPGERVTRETIEDVDHGDAE